MKMKHHLCIIFIFLNLSQSSLCENFNVISDSEVLLSNGKKEYEMLLQKKNTPLYGECWNDAISRMERSCKLLDEYRQSWLATLFTNCFLKASGFDNELLGRDCIGLIDLDYENILESELKLCTQNIDMKIFHTYSLFYVHTQSICFYLQSERWQKRTEHLVDHLLESSHLVSQELVGAVGNIEQLKLIQDNSLNTQRSINDQLHQTKAELEDFNAQSKVNRDLLERVIDQFILLRHFILVEFSLNSSLFFYIISMIIVYFITTTKRASGVRLPLYMLIILSFIIEKKCIDFVYRLDRMLSEAFPVGNQDHPDVLLNDLTMSRTLWMIRKTMMTIMAFVYLWWIATYRDISQISFKIINEHTKILKEIQRDIKGSPESKFLRFIYHFYL